MTLDQPRMTLDQRNAWATDPELRAFYQAVDRAAALLPRPPQRRTFCNGSIGPRLKPTRSDSAASI